MRFIGSHQRRPAHTSKLTRFRIRHQHMIVSLRVYAGKLTQNLGNLLAYAGQLWECKTTCLCWSVVRQVTSFFSKRNKFKYTWLLDSLCVQEYVTQTDCSTTLVRLVHQCSQPWLYTRKRIFTQIAKALMPFNITM